MSKVDMPIEQVITGFDDEALTRTMIATAAAGIGGLFVDAPQRVQATRDRVVALMCAAPDLLEALREAEAYVVGAYECAFPDEHENVAVLERVRAAITKAEGK